MLVRDSLTKSARTALLVIATQRDSCAPEGAFARAGIDTPPNAAIVDPIRAFIDASFRRHS